MTRIKVAVGVLATALLVVLVLALGRGMRRPEEPSTVWSAVSVPSRDAHPPSASLRGFLHGRVTTVTGATYTGRIRFGGDEEAFWGDTFNGVKSGNPWAELVPADRIPTEERSVKVFGLEIMRREATVDLGRPFMARFGDIARVEAQGDDVRVTLKSGTTFGLDRFEAGDFDDGVRVWDGRHGVVDLDTLEIRAIEFLPSPAEGEGPYRLHGTVHTGEGVFAGFLQWNRSGCVGSDTLAGRTDDGGVRLRFDTIRSIARQANGGSLVTLVGGREIVLFGTADVGEGNHGIRVDDPRYGRVRVSWHDFERAEFAPAGSGPGYDDFLPGRPLSGRVTTRAGDVFAGRLVFDLDESESAETLDAPFRGLDFTIPFGRIVSILLPDGDSLAAVTLRGGEELRLERAGDLGEGNAGTLVFVEGSPTPAYMPWSDVRRIDLDLSD